jgi:RNA polymerase sigma-70 factor (sigma-E family)
MRDADERSFEEFVRGRSQALLRTAYLLTGDWGHAEDLLQVVLTATYRHWRRIASDAPEAYVRRGLVNQHITGWRRRRFTERPLESAPPPVARDDVSLVDHHDEVWRALQAVSPTQRAVLVLRYYEGLSEAEIAAVLACAPGSVKAHASRGLAVLRLTLARQRSAIIHEEQRT